MQSIERILLAGCFGFAVSSAAFAEPEITDAKLSQRFNELSASTLVDGAGWEAYEKHLHQDYSRWAMGEIYEGREKFVRSLEDWWDYGMRVTSRDIDLVGVDITDDLAIIRFKTTEAFVGPDGPVEGFSGYVSNIWIKEDGEWKLIAAEIYSTQREDVKPAQDTP